jgi:hypothetical protein
MGLPPSKCLKARAFLGHARAEDKKLIKELSLEVLALKVPFRKPAVALFLNRSLVAEQSSDEVNICVQSDFQRSVQPMKEILHVLQASKLVFDRSAP